MQEDKIVLEQKIEKKPESYIKIEDGCKKISSIFSEPEILFIINYLARILQVNSPQRRLMRSIREIQEEISEIPGTKLSKLNKDLLDMLVKNGWIEEVVPREASAAFLVPGVLQYKITDQGSALASFLQQESILKLFKDQK